MTIQDLIDMLEEVEDKTMKVELGIASYSTDYFWITHVDEESRTIHIGTT